MVCNWYDCNSRHSNNPGWTGGASLIAEVGTVQLEFTYLSKHTGDDSYAKKSQRVLDHLDKMTKPRTGLYPIYIDPNNGQFTNQKITFGAMGDRYIIASYPRCLTIYASCGVIVSMNIY